MASVGWVKFFSNTKGFGFIVDVETKEDIFVHYSSLQRMTPGYKGLSRGEYVIFDRLTTDAGIAATNVSGLAKGPLLCEANSLTNPFMTSQTQ